MNIEYSRFKIQDSRLKGYGVKARDRFGTCGICGRKVTEKLLEAKFFDMVGKRVKSQRENRIRNEDSKEESY